MSDARLRVRRYEAVSAAYQALPRQYLRGRLGLDPGRAADEGLVDAISRAADGRFAYVSFLADRIEQRPGGDIGARRRRGAVPALARGGSTSNTAASRRTRSGRCWRCWPGPRRRMAGCLAPVAKPTRRAGC